jgi:hypothetical protein
MIGRPRQDMGRIQCGKASGHDRLQLAPERNVSRAAVRVEKQHATRVSPVAHVSQHAHERSDPDACGDEHQVVVDRVEDVGERNQTISFNADDRLNLDFTPHQTVAAPNLPKVGN